MISERCTIGSELMKPPEWSNGMTDTEYHIRARVCIAMREGIPASEISGWLSDEIIRQMRLIRSEGERA